MKVCIVGGGKVGFYLAKTLSEHGHEVCIVEKDKELAQTCADSLDLPVVQGDGTRLSVLQASNCGCCDAFVAAAGQDEVNLIACQLARNAMGAPKTVARVNNPKNAPLFHGFGVDISVSSTDLLARLIEREVENEAMRQLITVAGGAASLVEINLQKNFPFHEKPLREIRTPPDCTVVSITRGDMLIIPDGNAQLCTGDRVICLGTDLALTELTELWQLNKS